MSFLFLTYTRLQNPESLKEHLIPLLPRGDFLNISSFLETEKRWGSWNNALEPLNQAKSSRLLGSDTFG